MTITSRNADSVKPFMWTPVCARRIASTEIASAETDQSAKGYHEKEKIVDSGLKSAGQAEMTSVDRTRSVSLGPGQTRSVGFCRFPGMQFQVLHGCLKLAF